MSKGYGRGQKGLWEADDSYSASWRWKDGGSYKPSCYKSHPVLKFEEGSLVGGNCYTPVCEDADIYIGLDGKRYSILEEFPWNPPAQTKSPVIDVLFKITDGSVPSKPEEFVKMVHWVVAALSEGKKVHVGCMGGHGRTGLVLSAVVSIMKPEIEDAIGWVRETYCKKVVETTSQVEFLNKQFGIKKVEPSKPSIQGGRGYRDYDPYEDYGGCGKASAASSSRQGRMKESNSPNPIVKYQDNVPSIWGP